ncbi:MAG: DUF4405 domain-containing protein [Xanthomonadales bacterium]|nr:DUF4405 domain-containing protein [Xanthomonadales bacterium]
MSTLQRVWASIRGSGPVTNSSSNDPRKYLRNFLLHFRPAEVPERSIGFALTAYLGVASTVLLVMLILSGLMLKFVYEPSATHAYASIVYIGSEVPFGQLLRNLHRWSGYALLVTAFLHLLRVFYTGAFHGPRQFNWIIGLALMALVLLSNFTGYLLPWDQISYWAVTISTSLLDYVPGIGTPLKELILGGPEPGPATLLNFYALHTAILPLSLVFLVLFHFWRIRMAHGIVVRRAPDERLTSPLPMVRTVPHLVTREAAAALLVVAAMLALSMTLDAPLAEQANPGMSPNPTKAPWFFMGIQEILMHLHPLFAALVIPACLLAFLLCLPYLRHDAPATGVWFGSKRGRRTVLAAAIAGCLLTAGGVLLSEAVLSADTASPPTVLRNGLIPFLAIVAVVAGFYAMIKKALDASKSEAVQALFTFLTSAFLTLTLIGTWFRGAGMQLVWPG